MARQQTKPWHEVMRLREELRTGELSLAGFAADLHEVVLAKGSRRLYEDPVRFFALTYPTHALRELAKEVAGRLAGRSDLAVRQLELTYGGGKTHTLITLWHLFRDPGALPDLPALREFRQHIGLDLPRAFTVALCFDKIDVEQGGAARGPDGEIRKLKHPWSLLAFQLAGAAGLRALHADGKDAERETPPAEPVLVELLKLPQQRGMATLILVDEVLMFAREKAGMNPVWHDRIVDFFQYLTQAVVKVDRAALVASLLATDPRKQADATGQRMRSGLSDVFSRQSEEGVQPVQKADVPEILRRRFFNTADLQNSESHRAQVIGAVRAISKVDDDTKRAMRAAEEEFQASFPFHPDLTNVLYSGWTQLSGFQRTRGVLRTLATALRTAEKWGDPSPLVGPAALLGDSPRGGGGGNSVSDAVRELAKVASAERTEESSGKDWATLLEAELDKARRAQAELPALSRGREVEQAVIAVFLHSQPPGRKVGTPELLRMISSCGPDPIELEKGLRHWRENSWFLDDEDSAVGGEDSAALPKYWRLGNRPNLRQMHHEACDRRVSASAVEGRLTELIRGNRALTDGARASGVRVHMLPESPGDLKDDGAFHYAVLGPGAASESGKPNALAKAFLDETGGADRPRVNRNAVVLAVPSRDGLEGARNAVRAVLGWEDVQEQLTGQAIDPTRAERLRIETRHAKSRAEGAVRQAYSIVVTVNIENEAHAFKLSADSNALFDAIKTDEKSRIQEGEVNAEALLPGGPYDLWREDETAHRVQDLVGAFARYPNLPKMLKAQAVLDTVFQGVESGLFVARLSRPDGSVKTWWREPVEESLRREAEIEIVLPQQAKLSRLPSELLEPGVLPGLWPEAGGRIALRDALAYFRGGHAVSISQEEDGYEDILHIPRCSGEIVRAAVEFAVQEGLLWLTSGPSSIWKEDIPYGALVEGSALRPRPRKLDPAEFSKEKLPGAWKDDATNGIAINNALSQSRGETLPWMLVREGIHDAVQARWLELDADSGAVECGYTQAGNLRLRKPRQQPKGPTAPSAPEAVLDGAQMQELGTEIPNLMDKSVGHELRFHVRVSIEEAEESAPERLRAELNELLAEISEELKVS
ncbi:MAG: DUF499 domain-containing protein [Deltaproteobacteria bacterium]|nr:DUF499 domain-containing protein [Deltaproteobacteria bacterium]